MPVMSALSRHPVDNVLDPGSEAGMTKQRRDDNLEVADTAEILKEEFMESVSKNRWRLERRVSVSVLVQLLTLAGLIVGSWVNLQRQLDIVSHDVKQLLTTQEKFCEKLEAVQEKTIAHEYRLQTIEQKK